MFAKLSTLALLLPLVSATITINGISDAQWQTGGAVTLSWTALTTDPGTFSIELVNTAFHNSYAVGNNIPTANGQYSFQLPQVPVGGGYTINFVAPNNINQVFSSSNSFSIIAATSTTGTGTGTDSSTSSTPATTMSMSSDTSTPTSSTPLMTFTTPLSSATSIPAVTTGTSSAAASTPSTFNSSGAGSLKLAGIAPAAALALSVVAGAAMVF